MDELDEYLLSVESRRIQVQLSLRSALMKLANMCIFNSIARGEIEG